MGATLEGLVERLTLHDAPPDAILSNTFYITFRLFTTPHKLAETLVARFNIEPEPSTEDLAKWKRDVSTPVKLRVFNVFKGWMESHWRQETDAPALDLIVEFALGDLTRAFPQSGKRLDDLAKKVSKAAGPLVPRQVSSMGKAGPSTPNFVMSDSPVPPAIMSKSLLATLKASALGSVSGPSITDFDPLEIARQFTIKESKIFCAVLPEELVGQAFQAGKRGSSAVNVKALSSLSSVMTAWVADSIMDDGADAKRRAQIIKHWIKVCQKCLSLCNYSSLYNIFCALESTSVQRLNKTWPLLSAKHRETMDTLRHLTDVARNHAVYRAELRQRVPPCLPFMGLYLTDLTFVDEGNLDTRPVPDAPEGSPPLINFNKHIQTAKIIADVQRFQIPYRLQEVPEIQGWIEAQLARTKQAGSLDSMKLYRRSLAIEPREAPQLTVEGGVSSGQSSRRGSADDTNSPFSPLFTTMARERSSGGKLPTVQEEKRDNWSNNKI
jgi:RasGEF domain/RasGEF N-terminal motif